MSDGSRPRGYIPPPPSFSTAPDLSASIPPPPAPSFSSAPDIRDVYRDEESDRERRKRKKHKRDRSRERRRSSRSPTSKRRKSRSPSRRHRRSHEERRTRSPTRLTEKLDTGMVFVIDKYGDYDNLKYGGNNASSVPAYHRYGGGRILGLSPMYRIDTSSAKTSRVLSLTIRKPRRMPRYTDPDYAILENDRAVKRIKIKPGKAEPDPFGQLFIPLDVPSKKSGLGEEMISSGVDYRSIEGPKVKKDESDIDENDSDKEEGESFDEYVRRRKIEFEKELSEDPHNWQLWLDYIAFQDESAQGLNTGVQARFKANKSSLNEVKMSMFQKALESNPDNEDLLLGYLKLGSETWDTLTLLREWDTVLKKKPESIRLWAEYINLRQTNFASFSFTQCLKVFEDCIHTLNKVARRLQMKRKVENNYEGREEIESIMVYVLLRACLFMKQAGYHERAFGALQAQVEFSLFRPQVFEVSTEISFDDMIAEFDEFWDSEVPRFGERNANGWKEFYNQKSDEAPSNQDENQISQVAEDEDDPVMLGLRDWVRMEEKSERARRLPLRISTVDPELVDNDPFLVTLSDDLHGFLFNLTTQEARQSLIYSIFVFLGLPFTPPGVGTNTHFCIDTFTHNDINMQQFWPADDQVPQLITYIDGVPMEPEHYTGDTKPYDFPPSYPVGLTELFAEPGQWFNCLSSEPLECSADTEFCRNAFEQLLKRKWDNHLALCYLSLESRLSYKGAKSLAKRLLNDQRTNLVLWNAYAQMEKSQGHIKEARKVYRTVLATYRTFPEQDQEQVSVIFHMFADLELQQNCREEALKILVSISNDKPYDPALPITNTQILKAQKYYEQKTAQLSLLLSSEQESRSAFHYTACLALLQYLTQNVAAACRVYDTALEYIRDRQAERGFESEMLWVSKVCFLYRHAISGQDIHQPDEMRNTLEKAFSLFPNNTIFIGIYAWNESRLRIMNRVRAMFARSLHEHPNIILWLSSLYDELHRRRPYDVNQVRSSFDAAVEQSNTRSSVLLWKLYIEHEVRRNEIERAKRLFYRSLQACPWSKELYLLGIRLLARYLSEKERHEIVSLMMEKEIRLRKEIPEELFS